MPELYGTLLGIIGGAISGFLTSLYFWSESKKKERPRILVDAKGQGFLEHQDGYAQAVFSIRNVGSTYAENIYVANKNTGKKIRTIAELQPGGIEHLTILNHKESVNIRIGYQDVWGKKYESIWYIEGPHLVMMDEGDVQSIDYSATRVRD